MNSFRLGLVVLLCAGVAACGGGSSNPVARYLPDASPNVDGAYRYSGAALGGYFLRGTIHFEQTGDDVVVTDTTYDNAFDRALEGSATLDGNRLAVTLVPQNGDTDYEAEVTFLFSASGDSFQCSFSDTNGDAGPMGSYFGSRDP